MNSTILSVCEQNKSLTKLKRPVISGFEIMAIAGLFIVFLLGAFTLSDRFAWWQDEVMLVDPAVNLYLGKGFTSTAWHYQNRVQFWAGNFPLYSILIYGWIKLFGFTAVAVRSFNYFLMVISGLMLWLSVIRLNLVASSGSRIALIAIFFLGEGLTFNYSTARYDCLGIALFAAGLLIYSLPSIWIRCLLLSCIGIFISMTGIQLIAYTILLCGLLVVYLRNNFLREVVSLAIGGMIGGLFLVILYATNGVLLDFLKSTLGTGDSITGKIGQAVIQHDYQYLARYGQILGIFFQDRSFLALLALAIGMGIYKNPKREFQSRSILSFGLAVAIGIPIGVFILGKFPIYYSWMAFIPLAICVCSKLDASKFSPKKWTHLLVLGVLTIICLVGFPQRSMKIASEWNARDYAQIEALVERNVTKNDWVYSDYNAYYAIKTRLATAILPNYAKSAIFPTIPEREKVSIMIVQPKNFQQVAKKLGGYWYDSGDGINSKLEPYNLKVFRKNMNS